MGVSDLAEHEACVDYEESESYHNFYIRPYGNATLFSALADHPLGNVTTVHDHPEWSALLKANVRK